jgi:hypothetical protein
MCPKLGLTFFEACSVMFGNMCGQAPVCIFKAWCRLGSDCESPAIISETVLTLHFFNPGPHEFYCRCSSCISFDSKVGVHTVFEADFHANTVAR